MKILLKYSALLTLIMSVFWVGCQEPITQTENPVSGGNSVLSLSKDGTTTYPLYAGQHILVGYIEIANDDDYIYVKYVITEEGWCLTETHVAVGATLDDIPQKNGNPAPGQFPYKNEHDCVSEYEYLIPNSWECDQDIIVAAHAVVKDLNTVCYYETDLVESLPEQVQVSVKYPFGGGPAYFPETTVSGGSTLDGTYLGWCVDTDRTIGQNTNYTANVYSSYEDLPDGVVENPQNFDLVNWILNQGFIGQASDCGGNYTYGDIQRAIWTLVDDQVSTSGLGSWSQCRVDEILAAAAENGEGFVPECGDIVAVIFVPVTGQQIIIAQVIVGEVSVPCVPVYCEDETAWGDGGGEFPGNNWATYMTYTVVCDGSDPDPECDGETAWGGDTEGSGPAWWFYFDTEGSATQTIYAGQNATDGTVTYDSDTDVLTIDLGSWELQNGDETVKVEGYDEGEVPSTRPPAGPFTLYKGTDLTVQGDGSRYYAIHLDIQFCEE